MANQRSPRVTPRPKLAHVAMAANVSIGTASDALRGRGRVSEETRERVVAAAESLGYRANANARILASARTHVVALVLQWPDEAGTSRIYWPRVQAAFTERLFTEGLVACTMNVSDLHQLNGLPFDLIVYASPDKSEPLPEDIRSAYHVMEVDLAGSRPQAIALQEQVRAMTQGVLDELAGMGSRRPSLVISSDPVVPITWLTGPYEDWCADRAVEPLMAVATDGSATGTPRGADGVFRTAVAGDPTPQEAGPDIPTIQLVAQLPPIQTDKVHYLTIDGSAIGIQLADNAISFLRNQPTTALQLGWLLDGQSWQPKTSRQR